MFPTPTPTPGVPTTTTQNARSADDLKAIREKIQIRNEQVAHGEYSKSQPRHFKHIYVLQVHSRHEFLAYLLLTMSKIVGLGDGSHLLVLSHDIWHDEMNMVTENVQFMPAVNIFYPKSMLFYRNEFPAPAEGDCPVRAGLKAAKEQNCSNWNWPDTFGNYR